MTVISVSNLLELEHVNKSQRMFVMFREQKPTVGAWFVNLTGQLIKVKLVMFNEEKLHRVLIQYLDGTTKLINKDDWFCLKFNKHIHESGITMRLH